MANLVRASAKSGPGLDPTFYPIEEKVGEDLLQRWIMELLRPLIDRWLRHQGVTALVGADQFIYYRQYAPTLRVAPDIYVLPGVAPDRRVSSWKTWETGIVPTFALEIASGDWEKDYAEAPERYGELGVGELLIFESKALGCFLRAVEQGDALRIRLGTGSRGDELFQTAEEAERSAKEAERAAKEAAIAARERAAKEGGHRRARR